MPFDALPHWPSGPGTRLARRRRGRRSQLAGHAAEAEVARHYERRGARILARRWRGRAGEIDLIAEDGGRVVFVEVRLRRSHAEAAESIGPAKLARLTAAAEEYLGRAFGHSGVPARIDAALVDRLGRIRILPGILPA
ncbi:MAG: hypothetical protein D6832_07175 [Alphaproteobacteria bacterium]|nr:MAG: hypothetical protein D6832_07175 [Alphaproteobacteria bacterium]